MHLEPESQCSSDADDPYSIRSRCAGGLIHIIHLTRSQLIHAITPESHARADGFFLKMSVQGGVQAVDTCRGGSRPASSPENHRCQRVVRAPKFRRSAPNCPLALRAREK